MFYQYRRTAALHTVRLVKMKFKRRSAMSEVAVQASTPEEVVSAVIVQLSEGQVEDATASFAEEFRFKDHGIELEFTDKGRLTEFFQKARELYPDYVQQVDRIFVSGEYVITEWTLQLTITEPFYAGRTRRVPISFAGASIVWIRDGKIADWADYYDGLTSRRTALAAHFEEWGEL
jgi:steroid delta-isomerase-like uncharacterized protein